MDLLIDPRTRGVEDLRHSITAVASSTSIRSATGFIRDVIQPRQSEDVRCIPYGSYEELMNDSNFDILYISTPHSHHFQNCMLALNYGKNIVCEKPLAVNSEQARVLYQKAQSNGCFLMEAVWTRFFPLSIAVRDLIKTRALGDILRVYVNNSTGVDVTTLDPKHRYLNKDLAGGALLDIGVYALTWLFQTLYNTNGVEHRKPPTNLKSIVTCHEASQTDQMVSMIMEFARDSQIPGHGRAHGIATTSMILPDAATSAPLSAGPTVHIYGLDGEIQVFGPAHRPEWINIIPKGKGKVQTLRFEIPAGGHGMFWEADEAAICWRDGKLESETIPWEESVHVLEIADAIRRHANLTYPDAIETIDYPIQLPAKAPERSGETKQE